MCITFLYNNNILVAFEVHVCVKLWQFKMSVYSLQAA